jgi:hypothetical protein
METRYAYIRDDQQRPLVTICVTTDGNKTGVGIALCSEKDNPLKKQGRSVARQRAEYALSLPTYSAWLPISHERQEMLRKQLNRKAYPILDVMRRLDLSDDWKPPHKAICVPAQDISKVWEMVKDARDGRTTHTT